MDPSSGPGDHPWMYHLSVLYRCFRTGSCPDRPPAETADAILSTLRLQKRTEGDGELRYDNSVELTCMSASLLRRITCGVRSRSFNSGVTSHCEEVLRVLLEEREVMSELVRLFQSEHLVVSHLAAKTAAASVLFCLQFSGSISLWKQVCEMAFQRAVHGPELDACLWSLTDILKSLLKGNHQELFMKLLSSFDPALISLYSNSLLMDGGLSRVDHPSSSQQGATLCLLLDLLEVLTWSSLTCGVLVCLRSQRMAHTHTLALLKTASSSTQYFVRKRAILLMKRCVLLKAGEDWAAGGTLIRGIRHQGFSSDMDLLAHSVLTAVAAGWLEMVHVESSSFSGGSIVPQPDEEQRADSVMLRAVSLLLLKSAEVHLQSAAGTGLSTTPEVYEYLQSLWSFLRRSSVHLSALSHRCCWVSVLFGEQDDDMMEAAKASLSIFLHHRRCSGLDDSTVLDAACSSGNNPHCIFLLLLQSISFDHSILLDFLISMETCFLEFLVRYLKILAADWSGFTGACKRISYGQQQWSPRASCGPNYKQVTTGDLSRPRLVQYGSSEESEEMEDMVEHPHEERTGVRGEEEDMEEHPFKDMEEHPLKDMEEHPLKDMEEHPLEDMEEHPSRTWRNILSRTWRGHPLEDMEGHPLEERTGVSGEGGLSSQEVSGPIREDETSLSLGCPNMTLKRREGSFSGSGQQIYQTCPSMTSMFRKRSCDISERATICLAELQALLIRLQRRNLFPYNSSSLLKVLAEVENISQQLQ